MQENKSQTDRFSEVLQSLRNDVTADDRKAARESLDVSNATISAYLNGQVANNDTAAALISFFKNCISKRDKAVA